MQTCAVAADFDGDGDDGFAIGGRQSIPSLYWWRRAAGGWTRYVVADSYDQLEAGMVAVDVDGDGDLDLLAGEDYNGNQVFWWENPHPNHDPAVPWMRRTIKETGPKKHHDMAWGDVDGDGQGELIFWNQCGWDEEPCDTTLVLAEVPANPYAAGEWVRTVVFQSEGYYEGLAVADVNQDGKADIVCGGMWFEHMGGVDYLEHALVAGNFRKSRVAVGDAIPDGWLEIFFLSGDITNGELRMYEHLDGEWIVRVLLTGIHYGHSLALADFNGDGDLDVFVAEMRYSNPAPETAATWILYGNGAGGFTPEVIAEGYEHHESQVGDLDGDGDIDILGKPYNWDTPRVDVWLNGGAGPVATPTPTVTSEPMATNTPESPLPTPTPEPTQQPAEARALAVWGDEYWEFEQLSHTPELWVDLEVRDSDGVVLHIEMQDTGVKGMDVMPVGLVGVFTPTLPTTPTGQVWIYPYYHAPEDAWIGYVEAGNAYTESWVDLPIVYGLDCEVDARGFCYYADTTPAAQAAGASWIWQAAGLGALGVALVVGIWYARKAIAWHRH